MKVYKRGPYKKKPKATPEAENPIIENEFENLKNAETQQNGFENNLKNISKEPQTTPEVESPIIENGKNENLSENEISKEPQTTPEAESPIIENEFENKNSNFENEFEKSGEQVMDDWMKEYETVEPEVVREQENIIENKTAEIEKKQNEKILKDANAHLMNGGMLIAFCDFLFPSVFKFIHRYLLRNEKASKVRHTDVILNKDQIDSIRDVSDVAAKVVFEKINPLVLFALSMGMMYGTNFKIALDNVKEEEKEKK